MAVRMKNILLVPFPNRLLDYALGPTILSSDLNLALGMLGITEQAKKSPSIPAEYAWGFVCFLYLKV